MIRNSKNIKKIQLLYNNIEEDKSKSKTSDKEKTIKENLNKENPVIVNSDSKEMLNNKYIRNDIIKTFLFVIFSLLILYLAYKVNLFAMIFVK